MHKSKNQQFQPFGSNDEMYDFATTVQNEFHKEYDKYLQTLEGTFKPDPNIADIVYTVVLSRLQKRSICPDILKIKDISSI